ncbi:secreted protein [Nannochloropsis gaditana]|uniref:Secreted protein n=1 Tax=Nannochloropsis gaditana TaxID=72520 RepID=W7TIR5_9STRA|nr:secreted protein [Nannochloropsis gaditana]
MYRSSRHELPNQSKRAHISTESPFGDMSRLFGILLVVFLGLAGVLTTVSQECPRLTLKAKARPNAKRGILAGKGRARITVTLSSKDPVDNLEFQLKLPNGLSVERTTMRPSSKPSVPLQIVEDSDGTSTIYWLGIAFTKRKGGKLRFRVKVKADECAPETLAVDAFAYLVNATAASCITPLVNAAIVKVRYSKLDKAATCAPTPAPSINPTQPFVLFGAGQRFSQGGRLAPFQNRRLSARSGMNTHGTLAALSQPRDRHLQSIDTPEACYEYCSLNAGEETPFFFSWNIVTRQCFCCVAVCTPFVFDPDSNVYEALLPKTLPPVSMPTAAPSLTPSMTPTAAPTTAPTASPTAASTLAPTKTPGGVSWAQNFGGVDGAGGTAIAVNASGGACITGYFYGTMTVGSANLTAVGGPDIFMIKLDLDGNPVWAQSFGGTDTNANGIALDASGSSYTAGGFTGNLTVGSTTLTSAGFSDIFMIKLDPDGNPVWAQGFGGTDSNVGFRIGVDASGSSYTAGSFKGNMTVGSVPPSRLLAVPPCS